MTVGSDEKITAAANELLKRPLSKEEELELYRITDILGMKDVQSFLHQLLVFKMHEDTMKQQFTQVALLESRLNGKFDEIGILTAKIDETLKVSVEKILGEGAVKISQDMEAYITEGAKEALGAKDDYQFLRGQVYAVCLTSIIAALSYWMGTAEVFRLDGSKGFLDLLFTLPVSWLAFLCSTLHTFMWAYDHWKLVKKSPFHKSLFALQCFITMLLIIFLL